MRIATLLCLIGLLCFSGTVLVHAQPARDLSTDGRVLTGVDWRVVSFGPTSRETSVLQGTVLSLSFSGDRSVRGSSGCNQLRGSYDVSGDRISFGALISTRRACVDRRATEQEQRYISALESVNRFRIASTRLTLFYNSGRSVINLEDANATVPDGPQPAESNDPVAALSAYYDAINSGRYPQAYRMWETPETSLDRFTRGYEDTRRVRLLVEVPARIEGAAGSVYAQIPTLLVAEMRNGRERFFAGCYVMRRSNVSNGPWRIYRAIIAQVTASTAIQQPISDTCVKP